MSDNITPMREKSEVYLQIPFEIAMELHDMCKKALNPNMAQFILGQIYMYLHLSVHNDKMGGKEEQ